MRFFYLLFTSLFLLNSCKTTVVSAEQIRNIDSAIEIGKTYTFVKHDGTKYRFEVSQKTPTHLLGKNSENDQFNLEKAQIATVTKMNTLGTTLILAGIVAAAVTLPAYIKNKPVGQ